MIPVLLLVIGASALVWLVTGEDNEDSEAVQAPTAEEKWKPGHMTPGLRAKTMEILRNDPDMQRLTRGSEAKPTEFEPWVSEGATELLGINVSMDFEPPLAWKEERVPVRPTEETEEMEIPDDELYAIVTAKGIGGLDIKVDFEREEGIRFEPVGPGWEVQRARLSPALQELHEQLEQEEQEDQRQDTR